MFLQQLSILNFKNHRETRMEFCPDVNIFTGKNGTGKTNILDAIYYLCFCRSFLNPVDRQLVLGGENFFMLSGDFVRDQIPVEVHCSFRTGVRKKFKKNKKEYERLSDHIGEFPAVVISPYDTDLISEGSDTRRKFIDSIISQYNRPYLEMLVKYNKILQHRNTLLRNFRDNRHFDSESLAVWDVQMTDLADYIHAERKKFVAEFTPVFQRYYSMVSNGRETISIEYESQLHEAEMAAVLIGSRKQDCVAGFSTTGIHKDDLLFRIEDNPVKKFGSQGQQKSFLIGLKLAQFDVVSAHCSQTPILLLDDIFDKLDQERVEQIMKLMVANTFGQVFITDTDPDRIEKVFRTVDIDRKLIDLNHLYEAQKAK